MGSPSKQEKRVKKAPPESGAKPRPKSGAKPGPKSGAKPGPKSGAKPRPESGAKPGPKSGAKPLPKSGAKPRPESGAKPRPESGAKPRPKSGAKPRPKSGVTSAKAGYIYMNVLRGSDEVDPASAGAPDAFVVLKVGKVEKHRLGVRMRDEREAALGFGLQPGWNTKGTSGVPGKGDEVSEATWKASFTDTQNYPDAAPYLAVDDIANDEGRVRMTWIKHGGAMLLRDDAALQWLKSHAPANTLTDEDAKRNAKILGAMTELLLVPSYAFKRVQQRARAEFATDDDAKKKWTLQELAIILKGSLAEQQLARVFAETRWLLATKQQPKQDELIAKLCDDFAARLRDLLGAKGTTSTAVV